MKYLKLYNKSSNEYYTLIDLGELNGWIRKKGNHQLLFNSKEELAIISLTNSYTVDIFVRRIGIFHRPYALESHGKCFIDIYKYPDEYYIVHLHDGHTYYKCDGFEGVIKLLQDINI